ncbi:fuseless isoform a [Holotrichia oblita]|uniref:Fuseless isoform a n=1 Tax=Holotrichia oblita TaxID=644536 RepID=A0ACB9T4C7_HOLOL|nr:fuseless isoform a [Holotrichia oblita]
MRGSTAGITSTLKEGSSAHYLFLCILDSAFSAVVIAPAVVGYWRSVWGLMGIYVYPDDIVMGGIVSIVIGVVGHIVFALTQKFFERHLHPDKKRILFYICSRIYTTCFAIVCVNGWRGPWLLLDYYFNYDLTIFPSLAGISVIALGLMRTLRNVSAPPLALVTDHVEDYFTVPTMFRVKVSNRQLETFDIQVIKN